jgi:50S ribosomal protein L16 3-hydroxylase
MLKHMSPDRFLTDCWQKRPLFIPDALDRPEPVLTGDELAWLATLPDVESRLVFTDRSGSKPSYRLEEGPFKPAYLQALPEKDWTLLIQDVEKHLPDFRAWLNHFRFIPDWRIDDLMVSVAAPGGSVGPHRDNYDVFLCQGEGTRTWSLGDPDSVLTDRASQGLSLLQEYAALQQHEASSGDVLYLPPGIPHWGVARSFCLTYSVGMRAPTRAELQAGANRVLYPDNEESRDPGGADVFYADTDLRAGESHAGEISQQSLARMRDQQLLDSSLDDAQLALVLGSVVTDPKAWLAPEADETFDLALWNKNGADLPVHGMALIAWYDNSPTGIVFANGVALETSAAGLRFMRELCRTRMASAAEIQELCQHGVGMGLLNWLLEQGVFDHGRA